MESINKFITEKLEINEKLILNKNTKIDSDSITINNIKLCIPIHIKLINQDDIIEIWNIESKTENDITYYQFFDYNDNLILDIRDAGIKTIFKNKEIVSVTIFNLNGKKHNKSEVIQYIE